MADECLGVKKNHLMPDGYIATKYVTYVYSGNVAFAYNLAYLAGKTADRVPCALE